MLILAILDSLYRPMPISAKAHQGHVLSAGFEILLLGIAAVILLAWNRVPSLGWIGSSTLLIAIIGLTYRTEKKRLFLAWDSIGILLMYVVNLMLSYMLK